MFNLVGKTSSPPNPVVIVDEEDKSGNQTDKISTGLVECERVKAKIGKALHADGSPYVWMKFPPARGQKGFLS